eukprot:5170006-Lingulodinium_polyedra.AAC.1
MSVKAPRHSKRSCCSWRRAPTHPAESSSQIARGWKAGPPGLRRAWMARPTSDAHAPTGARGGASGARAAK